MKSYYLILELTPDATMEEVKTAYREKIRFYHPDRWRDDPEMHRRAEERTKELNEAYKVLSNAKLRADYDRRTQPPRPTHTQPPPAWAQPEPPNVYRAEPFHVKTTPSQARARRSTAQPAPRTARSRPRSLVPGLLMMGIATLTLAWYAAGKPELLSATESGKTTPTMIIAMTEDQATAALAEMGEVRTLLPDEWCNQPLLCQNVEDAVGLDWSPDGETLGILNANRTISLWDVQAGSTHTVLGDTCPIKAPIINNWRTLAWSPDGAHLAAGGDRDPADNPADTLAVWNTRTWLIEQCLDADNVDSLAWSPDSQLLARSGAFNMIQVIVWDISTWSPAFSIDAGARGSFVRWSNGGRFLAYDLDARVGFQEVATGNAVEPIQQPWEAEPESPPTALEWSPKGDFVAVITQDSKLYVVEWSTGQTILQMSIPSMRQIAWHPDSNRIAVAGLPGFGLVTVSRAELREFDLPTAVPGQATSVDAVAWSPSGRNLAAIVRVNGNAAIWIWAVNF